ncbi:MAG: alpha/beta fold hydrolase [Nannocystaceae bacterium]
MGAGVEEFSVDVASGRLAARRQGRGPALVLCHGGPGIADGLGELAALLSERATVIRFDQRGGGGSTRAGPFDVDTLVADLEALRGALGLEDWIVAGHSWGANLALAYASRHPSRTRAVLYLSGTGLNPAWQEEARLRRLSRLARRDPAALRAFADHAIAGDDVPEEVAARHALARKRLLHPTEFADPRHARRHPFNEAVSLDVNRRLWRSWRRFSAEPSLAAAVAAPVYLLHGDADPRPRVYIEELAAALPRGQLQLLAGVGHYPWVEDPPGLQRALLAAIDAIEASRGAARRGDDRPAPPPSSFAKGLADKYGRPEGAPWEIGRPQRAVVDLVAAGAPRGRLLDVGCGTAENAALLAEAGADAGAQVVGVDVSEAALRRAKAPRRGSLRLLCDDVLALRPGSPLREAGRFDAALDSGFFHNLSDDERRRYVAALEELLVDGATLHLLAVSDEEPGTWGPRRISRDVIAAAFAGWELVSARRSIYESRVRPRGAAAWWVTLRRACAPAPSSEDRRS